MVPETREERREERKEQRRERRERHRGDKWSILVIVYVSKGGRGALSTTSRDPGPSPGATIFGVGTNGNSPGRKATSVLDPVSLGI